jgi:hypothetical protein
MSDVIFNNPWPTIEPIDVDLKVKQDGITDIWVDLDTNKIMLEPSDSCKLISRVYMEKGKIKIIERTMK